MAQPLRVDNEKVKARPGEATARSGYQGLMRHVRVEMTEDGGRSCGYRRRNSRWVGGGPASAEHYRKEVAGVNDRGDVEPLRNSALWWPSGYLLGCTVLGVHLGPDHQPRPASFEARWQAPGVTRQCSGTSHCNSADRITGKMSISP